MASACKLHVNTTRTGKVKKEKAQLVIGEQEQLSLHHLESNVCLQPSNWEGRKMLRGRSSTVVEICSFVARAQFPGSTKNDSRSRIEWTSRCVHIRTMLEEHHDGVSIEQRWTRNPLTGQ